MKKILSLLFVSTIFLTISLGLVSAKSSETSNESTENFEVLPIENIDTLNSLFGQDHKYTVYYKDSGEALVLFVATLMNTGANPLSEIEIKTSDTVSSPTVFQIIKVRCVEYDDNDTGCLKYEEADYLQFYSDMTYYLKSEVTTEKNALKINLSRPIASNKAGSYILAYTLENALVNKLGGTKAYTFNSLTTESPIQNLSIGITSQTPRKFRDAPWADDKIFDNNFVTALSNAQTSELEKFQSNQMDNLIGSVGYATVTKYASFLNPGETYTVSGSFASNYISLYLNEILIVIVTILIIIVILTSVVLIINKKWKNKLDDETFINKKNTVTLRGMVANALISFVFATTIAVTIFGLYFLRSWIDMWSNYRFVPYATLLLTVKASSILQVLFYGPLIFLLVKKGVKKTLVYFSFFAVWILLYVIIAIIIFSFFGGNSAYSNPGPIPYPVLKDEPLSY